MLKRSLFTVLLLALVATPATSQLASGDAVVDRVLAIVGDSVVLQSQIEEEIQRMRLQDAPVPDESDPAYEDFFDGILDSWINRVLVLQAAARDTLIAPDDATIDQRVSQQINQVIESMGGRGALTQALASEGLTLAEYRDILTTQARQQQIQQMFMQRQMQDSRPVDVSDDELRARFEQARTQMQQRPRSLTFHQVVIIPEASEEARAEAEALAEDLLQRIRDGEDFAQLARRYSDDPGSAELGGDLGWFRRGRMVQEFEDAAFSLPAGAVSQVVETEFGFHIIKVERTRPGERQGRHILIVPEKTDRDIERARTLAESITTDAQAGASMDSLYQEYSDPAAPDSLTVSFDQLGELPPEYEVLRGASEGEVLGPVEYEGQADTRFAVIKVERIREAGTYTFEDVRGQIASQVQQERRLDRVIEELRQRTHIEILR
ncbi:MAG: peptidylprolyl isomerase [Gemmatimonadota bacterium]|nr:peptidylprolyl isomerase [Gemmatimonadota bacterium]